MTGFGEYGGGDDAGGFASANPAYALFNSALVLQLDASTLAGSAGASVTSWPSLVGAYNFTGGTSPTLRPAGTSNLVGSIAAVRFARASSQYLEDDTAKALVNVGGPLTIACWARRASDNDENILGFGVGATVLQFYFDNFSSSKGVPKIYNGSANPSGNAPLTLTTQDAWVVIVRNPGGTSSVWANGQKVTFSLAADANTYTSALLGAVKNNGTPVNFANGDYGKIYAWSSAFDDAHVAAATIVSGAGAALLPRWQAVALGDSITAGTSTGSYSWFTAMYTSSSWQSSHAYSQYAVVVNDSTNLYECTTAGTSASSGGPTGTGSAIADGTCTWRFVNTVLPSTCLNASGTAGTGINQAVSGQTLVAVPPYTTTNNTYDNLPTYVAALYSAYVPRLIFVFCGTNDVYYGGGTITGADVWARYVQVCNQIRADNPRDTIVAVTPLVRSNWSGAPNYGGDDAPYNQALADFASLVRANYGSCADVLWDARATPNMGDSTDTTWYLDGAHPTVHGQTQLLAYLPIVTFQAAAISRQLSMMLANLP